MFLTLEFLCYASIIRFVYDHNNVMLNDSIISMETYKKRQKLSAFSLTSQAYCFMVKLVYIGILNIALALSGTRSSIEVLELANALRIIQFGIISIIQVLFSPEIRKDILGPMDL